MTELHNYSIYLSSQDPTILQPTSILKELKPHQKAAIHKCIHMETDPYIHYDVPNPESLIALNPNNVPYFKGKFTMHTNVGIIGDIVGYGKTLIALSIVAMNPIANLYSNKNEVHSYGSTYYSGSMTIYKERMYRYNICDLLRTTLVVVPRGPVYIQWKKSIEADTTIQCLFIESLHTIKKELPKKLPELKAYLESYQMILIKSTTLKVWLHYLQNLETPIIFEGFERIMIDEAHDIAYQIPRFNFKYLWLITSSYTQLLNYSHYSKSIVNHFSLLLNRERMHYMLVKSEKEFILKSFNIPAPVEHYYLCRLDKQLSALTYFVSQSICDKINVNDISGAVHEIGGTHSTESSLVESVQKDFLKDIHNKEKELLFIESLDLENEQREQRLKTVKNELQRLKSRYESLQERLQDLETKTCPICMDSLDNPIYLNCTHTMCGKCLFEWAKISVNTRNNAIACPECRTTIDSNKIVAIIKNTTNEPITQLYSKEEHLLKILLNKPHGRFLIFSRVDSQFYHLCNLLTQNNIVHREIKGSTSHMMNILNDFNNGTLQVILLTTYHAGFGIDISSATDVIIYHKMQDDKIQSVGRAQRVGRKDTLTIHNLCYSHELDNSVQI